MIINTTFSLGEHLYLCLKKELVEVSPSVLFGPIKTFFECALACLSELQHLHSPSWGSQPTSTSKRGGEPVYHCPHPEASHNPKVPMFVANVCFACVVAVSVCPAMRECLYD